MMMMMILCATAVMLQAADGKSHSNPTEVKCIKLQTETS